MERQIHTLIQGSDEWHQFRLEHFGASEAAAMLGLSKKTTRSELLRMKHTGIAKEFSAWVQENILDHGHEVEALARPLIEAIIGEDLFAATYSFGMLSASCDGITMGGDIAFEHKQYSAALFAAVLDGELPDEHQPQCQQIMLVTGAEKVIFVCSDGTAERMAYVEVFPDPAWQSRLTAGWKQFATDLSSYVPVEIIPAAVGTSIKELPVLIVQVDGRVVSSNLAEYREIALASIADINLNLNTDQEFADAKKAVKWCGDGEDRLALVKSQALEQTASIGELFRTVDEVSAKLRETRLMLDKTIKARNDAVRVEIVQTGKTQFASHIASLNARIGKPFMPAIAADFAAAIKGKSSFDKMRDAVGTELARAKIDADAVADAIQGNLRVFDGVSEQHQGLFADLGQLVLKAHDDFSNAITLRITQHEEREAKRKADDQARMEADAKAAAERERDRIAAEERAKIEQEQRAAEAQRLRAEELERHANATAAAARAVAERNTVSAQPAEPLPVAAPVVSGSVVGNEPPVVWQQAKADVVTLLSGLTVAELHLVADFINRKAWRKAA
jgi:predicted phage-related endonuclease